MYPLHHSLGFLMVVDDFGNEINPFEYARDTNPRAVLNAIYFAYPGDSFYWYVTERSESCCEQ